MAEQRHHDQPYHGGFRGRGQVRRQGCKERILSHGAEQAEKVVRYTVKEAEKRNEIGDRTSIYEGKDSRQK